MMCEWCVAHNGIWWKRELSMVEHDGVVLDRDDDWPGAWYVAECKCIKCGMTWYAVYPEFMIPYYCAYCDGIDIEWEYTE